MCLNRLYLLKHQLQVELLTEETVWIDAGTPDLLLQAANFGYTMEVKHGLMIGSPEQAAYLKGFITLRKFSV
jgi:glucose-1-phosphate thymidylyltransferase